MVWNPASSWPEEPRPPGPPPGWPERPEVGRVVRLHPEPGISPFDRLVERRIVFLRGELDDANASEVVAWLLALDADGHDDVQLFIDSPGGTTSAMFAVHDAMGSLTSAVSTRVVGVAAAAAAFVLATGTGARSTTRNARIGLSQPVGEIRGTADELAEQAQQAERLRARMETVLAERTGQPAERIHADLDHGRWFSADEARVYGLVDEVVGSR